MQPEPQIVKLLTANGLRRTEARTLACWTTDDDELTQIDIENMSGLRQPEVSLAMRELRRRGWTRMTGKRQAPLGRPTHLYTLARPMADIARDLVRERNREIEAQMDLAAQLLQAVA